MNTKRIALLILLAVALPMAAQQRENLWPKGKMPHASEKQIGAMRSETQQPGFNAAKHRQPYLEWFAKPAKPNGGCMILISGGAYKTCCDEKLIDKWNQELTEMGFQCVNFVYRTPRPEGIPYWQTAWEDGQRAVRKVRSQAAKRGFDPERIGVVGMSAGGHLSLLLATNALTPAYEKVDALDDVPCHINIAIVNAPAYITSDADTLGIPAAREGYGADVSLSSIFTFDEKTCPMSLHHGGIDEYSPNGSTLVYRELRKRGIPAEVHLYPGKRHGAYGFDRAKEFLNQMEFSTPLAPAETLEVRFASDSARAFYAKEPIWPEGRTPCFQEHQVEPYIEWHIPAVCRTKAIQIIYSGGAYGGNKPDGFEVAPVRRYLNAMGIPVVTLKYRTPRPKGLAKHTTAWQDLQRAIRVVRKEAPEKGLDPNRIGIMGSSAGGHLTLMGVTSSRHRSYFPVDKLDKEVPCNVQWGIGIYPAYSLTDGIDTPNSTGGNADDAVLVPEFSFDLDTAPMLLIHGDADCWAAMNSVKVWEKMRSMGIQCELHTLAKREHCFQHFASPGTGSYTWMDRIGEYLTETLGL